MRSKRHGGGPVKCARLRSAFIVSTALLLVRPALAQESLPRNNYGSAGLIDMPSARMAADGTLMAGAFFTENIQRYNLGFQALPWLEVDFRYTGLQSFDPSYPVYYDRSFGLKARLWNEGEYLPTVAIGINDLVGTGVYSGEYLVASKRVGPVDLSLGMGWGRMGSTALFRNPLSLISESFDTRPDTFGVNSNAGSANFGNLFHGKDVGLFGGFSWSTPIKGLTLMGEYSSDAYTVEKARGTFRPQSQVNLGVSYQITDSIQLGLNWLNGRSIAGNISFELNPIHDPYPQRFGPPPPPVHLRSAEEQRAALETIVRTRDLPSGSRPAFVQPAFVAGADLADRLWQMPNLIDVSLNGASLTLAIARGDPASVCGNAASLAAQSRAGITSVSVTQGRASARCAVPTAPPLTLGTAPLFGTTTLAALTRDGPLVINAAGRTASADNSAVAKIRADATAQQLRLLAVSLDRHTAIVYYENGRYFSEISAVDRLSRILLQDAPAEVETFRMISVTGDQPVREFEVLRSATERTFQQTGSLEYPDYVTSNPAPQPSPELAKAAPDIYPRFTYALFPQFRQQLFDPSNPFAVQLLAAAQASLEILPGLAINTQLEASLYDNFNTGRVSDSVLPHVRTDFVRYFTEGKNGIANLDASYHFRLSPTVFAVVRAGYLESMFAGYGGEILWRPEGARWALGLDLYDVKQRQFDRSFGLQNYSTFTGHLSVYYASPWYDIDVALRAGQYLAGDRGLTVEVTRRFSTGVEIGAFFTATNVSAADFGEGSFDKGIMIRIPLNWIAPMETQSIFGLDLRPVQRDGGQRLEGDTRLFYETRRQSQSEILRQSGQ